MVVVRLKFMVRELMRSDYDSLYHFIGNSGTDDLFHLKGLAFVDFARYYDQYFESNDHRMVYVVLLDDKLIGKMELHYDPINKTGRFDIVVDQTYWGKGLAQKSLQVLFDYSFKTLSLNKMIAEVLSFNVRAMNFMHKMGMQLEGIFREERLIGDRYVDIYRYGLLRKEYLEG